jgi:DMSO/TMAO reductase YedYZ molybdopterin-dependent catalytic subunit
VEASLDARARARAGIAGIVAAGVALGVGELLAGVFDAVPSLLAGVGGVVVDRAPPIVKDVAISLFGTADKGALAIGTVIVALVVGFFTGRAALRRFWVAGTVFAGFALLGFLAGIGEPLASWWATALATASAAAAGLGILAVLLRLSRVPDPRDAAAGDPGRRRFLGAAAAGAVVAVSAGFVGRRLLASAPEPAVSSLPGVGDPVLPPGPGQALTVDGLSPVVTPNDRFYRIDTALVVPRIDAESWRLRVFGAVDQEVELTYDDLLAGPLEERYATIACVSNEVGGSLVGNAAWAGVPLTDVLDRAGVRPEGTQIVGRSIDGFTVGFPTEVAYDGRRPLVAVGMNGVPLPRKHGFPARLIVPGLYGYVSATKWLTEIELTGWDDFDAYWVPRGWAKEAPIKTQSRIDVPRADARVAAGPVAVAGVAWAPTRGIDAVEVRVDGGPWQRCETTDPLSSAAWVQWRAEVELAAGKHGLEVRATDGTGRPQTDEVSSPRPDGATGYHRITVTAG